MKQDLIINRLYSVVCHLSSVVYPRPSTSVEDSLQIDLFMQNKPNFRKAKMNVNIYYTKAYNKETAFKRRKNKPNSNPNKPNLRKAKMNVNLILTKDYRKKDGFPVQKNKAKTNPISEKLKMSTNVFITKDYENETAFRPEKNKPKTNPISSKPKMSLKSLTRKSGHALVVQGLIFSLNRYSPGGIITPVGCTKKQRSRRLLTTFFFSSVITEQKVGIVS